MQIVLALHLFFTITQKTTPMLTHLFSGVSTFRIYTKHNAQQSGKWNLAYFNKQPVALSLSISERGWIFNLLGKRVCLLFADNLRHFYN